MEVSVLFDYGERFYSRILDTPANFTMPDGRNLTASAASAIRALPSACWAPALFTRGGFIQPRSDTAPGSLPVIVNHGRWIVRCPCGGSQYACAIDRRFLCDRCCNTSAGGRWRRIEWPEDPRAIELALKPRLPEHQNWLPGETTVQLWAENDMNDRIRSGNPVPVPEL